jgi:hypothetical protein
MDKRGLDSQLQIAVRDGITRAIGAIGLCGMALIHAWREPLGIASLFVHTGQLFFPDAISDAVYRHGAYKSHGEPDTTNSADTICAAAGGSRAQVRLSKRHDQPGYRAQITVGVAS